MKKKSNIKVIKQSRPGSHEMFYLVKQSGNLIGFLSKFRNTRTETHPWKAFGMKWNPGLYGTQCYMADNTQFEVFYEEDGGINAAIEQVVQFYIKRWGDIA